MIQQVAAVVGFAMACAVVARAGSPLVVPGSGLPAAVAVLGPLDAATGFGVSADGAVAVAALPTPHAGHALLRIAHAETVKDVEVTGAVRALVVSDDGLSAFLIVAESDKKGQLRRTSLLRVDLAAGRAGTSTTLPATARGIAFGAGARSLLVAARDEIRTFVVPAMTSGPLYRVAGENTAVAPLAGSTRAITAQGTSLVLVDLAASQDRDGLAILERVESGGEARALVTAPDQPVGLLAVAGGKTFDVAVDPLRLTPRGEGIAIAWPGTPSEAPSPEPAAVDAPPDAIAAPVVAAAAAAAASVPEEAPPPETSPAPAPPAENPPPVTPPPAESPKKDVGDPGTVTGTITGPALTLVGAVVALGPDNVLKEAARIAPDAAGRFAFRDLPAGTYRLVAAGSNGRVLVCDPPFVTIRVGSGASTEAPALSVLKGY